MIAGRYRLESLVRGGRASAVLGGVDTTKKAPVAIEMLIASGDEADAVGVRFLAAARRAALLESPHVARILDAGVTSDGHPYVVREWVREQSLAELLAIRGSIATNHAVDIALDVCDALEDAHAHQLLHGSLDTSSIHVDLGAGVPAKVKVVGIGTAHATLSLRAPHETTLRAPEQLDASKAAEPRTDVWALGVVLYTMLAGASPFAADTPSGASLSAALDEPAQLAGVPDELADIVESCLALNPALRPMSMHRLAEELARFATNPISAAARVTSREQRAPESTPTVIAGKTYDAMKQETALGDADATARRNALANDDIRLQAQPSLRDVDVEIDVEPSVRDVSKIASVPPPAVSRTVPPPHAARDAVTVTTRKPSGPRRWRPTALAAAAAAACVVVGIVAFAQLASSNKGAVAAAAAAPAEPPAVAAPAPAPEPPPSSPAPTTVAASALPDSRPAPVVALPHAPAAKPRATSKPTPSAPASEAAPAASPAATAHPEPKASDDDLRRFLDDRR